MTLSSPAASSRIIRVMHITGLLVLLPLGLAAIGFIVRDSVLSHQRASVSIAQWNFEIKREHKSTDYEGRAYEEVCYFYLPQRVQVRRWKRNGRAITAKSIDELLKRTLEAGYPKQGGQEQHTVTYSAIITKQYIFNKQEVLCARLLQRRRIFEMWSWPSLIPSTDCHEDMSFTPYCGKLPPRLWVQVAGGAKYPDGQLLCQVDLTRWKLGVRFDDDEGLKREAIRRYLTRHPEKRWEAEGR